ncbi:hypothetical protein DYBT9275_02258 [Dyadobacter sp. CECT 9275]|uniref:Uncharacterized protein n=1 Tax=Dyadobacter helix TaxID=2822344 RepID=A0A916JDS0_9BACT|nr:hypothetical protein [Dyadobacter sp. CECT 9275]CAG4999587.1 hypothetical protein DYBT9275_02258 [Dyadobacter sp. CECT 9275]
MEYSQEKATNNFYFEKNNEIIDELFNLSKTLTEMNLTIIKELEEIKANPVNYWYSNRPSRRS